MRLFGFSQSLVPVESHRRDEIVIPPAVPAPSAGRRWGKPSSFSHSGRERQTDDRPGITIDYPDRKPRHFMRIVPAQLSVQSSLVSVTDGAITVQVDRLERMSFHYTELRPKPHRGAPQPSRTTWFDMTFRLHPSNES